jgi:hypothetical protein
MVVRARRFRFIKKDATRRRIDILGQVKNAQGITVGKVRETVKLALDASRSRCSEEHPVLHRLHAGAGQVPPEVRGAREPDRQHGQLRDRHPGAGHEEDAAEAELGRAGQPAHAEHGRRSPVDPLVRDGVEWVPNVAHVFRQDQHLYFLYEVYDPPRRRGRGGPAPRRAGADAAKGGPVHVLTSIEFLLGGT